MKNKTASDLYWGLILVVIGGLFLAGNLGFLDFEFTPRMLRTYWPLILVILGGSIVVNSIGRSQKKKNANR